MCSKAQWTYKVFLRKRYPCTQFFASITKIARLHCLCHILRDEKQSTSYMKNRSAQRNLCSCCNNVNINSSYCICNAQLLSNNPSPASSLHAVFTGMEFYWVHNLFRHFHTHTHTNTKMYLPQYKVRVGHFVLCFFQKVWKEFTEWFLLLLMAAVQHTIFENLQ